MKQSEIGKESYNNFYSDIYDVYESGFLEEHGFYDRNKKRIEENDKMDELRVLKDVIKYLLEVIEDEHMGLSVDVKYDVKEMYGVDIDEILKG